MPRLTGHLCEITVDLPPLCVEVSKYVFLIIQFIVMSIVQDTFLILRPVHYIYCIALFVKDCFYLLSCGEKASVQRPIFPNWQNLEQCFFFFFLSLELFSIPCLDYNYSIICKFEEVKWSSTVYFCQLLYAFVKDLL